MLCLIWPKIHLWVSETKAHGENTRRSYWGMPEDVFTLITGPMLVPPVVQEVSTDIWLENLATEAINVTSVLQLGSSPGCSPEGHWPMSHTRIWQAHALLLSRGALGDLFSSAHLVEVILRISNYFGLKFRFFKLTVTHLQLPEMFTGMTVSRAPSCLNKWLRWFGFFFKSQNQFPVGNPRTRRNSHISCMLCRCEIHLH